MPYANRDPYLDARDPFIGDEDDFFPRPAMMAAASPGFENRNGTVMPAPNETAPQYAPQRTAMMELADLQSKRPLRSEHQGSGLRKVLGGIAGGLQGAAEGYMAVRGFRTPQGPNIGEAIVNAPYRKAMDKYNDQEDALVRQAQMEQQLAEQRRREAESQARITTTNKQGALADARTEKIKSPPPLDKPYSVAPGHKVIDPKTKQVLFDNPATPRPDPLPSNPTQEIALINRDSQLDTAGKKAAADAVMERWNKMHPQKQPWRSVVDAAGNVSVLSMGEDGKPVVQRAGDRPLGKPQQTRANAGEGSATPGDGKLSLLAQAVLDGADIKDFSQKKREAITEELKAAGHTLSPKLSDSQQSFMADTETTEKLIDEILSYAADGKLEGVGKFAGPAGKLMTETFGIGSEEAKNVRSLVGNVRGVIQKLRAGLTLTKAEEKQLNTYVPDINEHQGSVISKLNGLKQFLAQKKQAAKSLTKREVSGVPNRGTAAPKPSATVAPKSNQMSDDEAYQHYLDVLKQGQK